MAVGLVDPNTSAASPHVLLHPLALIAIDDHVSRSGVRRLGPIVGALLGRHNGKEIIVEQAFECGSKKLAGSKIDQDWFTRMLKLQLEIFPALSLLGWYTIGAEPQPWHISIQAQLKDDFECDSPIFLLYQPQLLKNSSVNGRLPFAIFEAIPTQTHEGMEVDGAAPFKFRQITFSLETAPDEAIGLADIMQGATVANAIAGTESTTKGKEAEKSASKATLTAEEDELLASIQTKANAIKMLQSRLDLITAYLKSQPASYLTDASISPAKPAGPIDQEVLRSIAALAAELRLTSPAELLELRTENEEAKTDSKVLELLANLTEHVGDIKVLGKRVQAAEPRRRKDTLPQGLSDGTSQDWS